MPINVTPVQENFGAEVTGVDLTRPVDRESIASIEEMLNRYAVLIFPGQPVNDEQQIALTRLFGSLESNPGYAGGKMFRREEVADFTNVAGDNSLMRADDPRRNFNIANQLWHTDSSFKHVPAKCSLLSAREISPVGGQTEFADLRSAYDALSDKRKQELEGLIAEHSIFYSRSQIGFGAFNAEIHDRFPPVNQMIVRRHSGSGRKTLYLAAHASHVVGWPIERGRRLIKGPDRLRDAAAVCLSASLACRGSGHMG